MAIRAVIEAPQLPGAARLPARGQRLAYLVKAVRKNRKATAGFVLLGLFAFLAAFPGLIAHQSPSADAYGVNLSPSLDHLLGTTSFGQDIFAQVIYGARETLVIAVVVGLLSTLISIIVGVSSAYLGGVADGVLSVITDIFLVIPFLPLVVVIAAYIRGGGIVMLISVLVLTGWAYGARQLRSQTLSLRNRDFLESARVRGERRLYIIIVEILPTMTSLLVAQFLGAALFAVLAAAGLQFIGLGDSNSLSWGTMLFFAQNNEALLGGVPLWAIMPGLCIALLGASFALLNYAFDEIGNPALRPVRKLRVRSADS
jgi:peptide/nickel transport system permease protein